MNKHRKQRPQARPVCAVALCGALTVSERSRRLALLFGLLLLAAGRGMAQTTAFTYQGRLADNNTPATGNYDFEFKLFDTAAVGTGTQQGATLQRLNVAVASGSFTVQLDFGACASCFNGSPRFLEIAVRPAGSGALTTLAPRQPISSTPYAIKGLNATAADGLSVACVSCISSSQIASVSGSAVSGPIPVASVPGGSANYIQNSTTQQAAANFNISGTGLMGGSLGIGTSAPVAKLQVHTTGLDQHLYLSSAAPSLALGNSEARSAATRNAIFALSTEAGHFGVEAGGLMIATYGSEHGNIYIDSNYSGGATNVILQPYIGNVSIGTTTPDSSYKLQVETSVGTAVYGHNSVDGWGVFGNSTGDGVGVQGNNSGDGYGVIGNGGVGVYGFSNTEIGVGVLGRSPNYAGYFEGRVHAEGFVSIAALGSGGSTALCRNASNQISTCSSSLRYKTAIQPFTGGLDLIKRLRPIAFMWKDGGMRDLGFGAEEVEKVEPLLVTYNAKGDVEGVKYDRITVALVNATREQQARIDQQQTQIKEQQQQLDMQQREIEALKRRQQEFEALKRLVCADHPNAGVCQSH